LLSPVAARRTICSSCGVSWSNPSGIRPIGGNALAGRAHRAQVVIPTRCGQALTAIRPTLSAVPRSEERI
jgi:hypothetical protein